MFLAAGAITVTIDSTSGIFLGRVEASKMAIGCAVITPDGQQLVNRPWSGTQNEKLCGERGDPR
jgi:hypothetical protein